jgi:AcrR family transcriptional regulator
VIARRPAAGVQPPAIYRFFGDKDGLLEAVAEHGYATFIAISGPSRRWTTRLRTCGQPRTWRSNSG